MAVLTSWVYPLKGIIYLVTAPALLQVVLRFLLIVTASSLACTALWVHLCWDWHLELVARIFGVNFLSKLITLLVLLSEAALPVYLVFDRRYSRMQQQLFEATLSIKHVSVQPLHQQDAEALTTLLAARQKKQQEAAPSSGAGSTSAMAVSAAGALASLLLRILFKPKPNEGLLVRKTRDMLTLGVSVFLPFLLPLMVYRDSHAAAAALLDAYWEAKGLTTPDSKELAAAQHAWDLRGFGLVAASLGYVPVLNWFLGLSNMVGAALYAAALEQQGARLVAKKKKH